MSRGMCTGMCVGHVPRHLSPPCCPPCWPLHRSFPLIPSARLSTYSLCHRLFLRTLTPMPMPMFGPRHVSKTSLRAWVETAVSLKKTALIYGRWSEPVKWPVTPVFPFWQWASPQSLICHSHPHVYAHAYTHTDAHVHTHAHARVHTPACTHFCTHASAHLYTHVHAHTSLYQASQAFFAVMPGPLLRQPHARFSPDGPPCPIFLSSDQHCSHRHV